MANNYFNFGYHRWRSMSKAHRAQGDLSVTTMRKKLKPMYGPWRHDQCSMLRLKTRPHRMTAFLLMAMQAIIAETHAAKRTIELLAMKNLVPAFAAFYSSIDQLKHQMFISEL
jgi:hypothetical protein